MKNESALDPHPEDAPADTGIAMPTHKPAHEVKPTGRAVDIGQLDLDPRGYPSELMELVEKSPPAADRESVVLQFIADQELKVAGLTDKMHWNRGAAVKLLFADVFPGKNKKAQSKYLHYHFGVAYNTIRKELRCIERYAADPYEYFRYTHSVATELSTLSERIDREAIYDQLINDDGHATVLGVVRVKAGRPELARSRNAKGQELLLLDQIVDRINFDGKSSLQNNNATLVLRMGYEDLWDADLNDLGRILNRHTGKKYRLLKPGTAAPDAGPAEAVLAIAHDEGNGA